MPTAPTCAAPRRSAVLFSRTCFVFMFGSSGARPWVCNLGGWVLQVYECNVTTPGGCDDVPSTFFIEDDADGSIKLRLCGPTDYQMTFDDEVGCAVLSHCGVCRCQFSIVPSCGFLLCCW